MSTPAWLDQLGTHVQGMVERVGAGFTAPDDDWLPVMLIQHQGGLDVLGLDFSLFGSHGAKDALADLLRSALVEHGAYRFALLLNTHELAVDGGEAEAEALIERVRLGERVENMPGSREQLTLIVGDAETEHAWRSLIERHPDAPPTLAPWVSMTGGHLTGRFAGLGEALRTPPPKDTP